MKDISKEEMIALLQKAEDGVLAFSDGDKPYCIPMGHVYVDGEISFSIFPKGKKWEICQKNKNVCFNVYAWNDDHTEWSSVVVDGEMVAVTDITEIEAVVKGVIIKMGLEPGSYLEKRMEYYKKNMDNPAGLKVFKIKARSMGGKTMPTMIGK